MEGTRVELGEELDEWEKSLIDAATMMWVYGGAGTGKTALLLTFADLCRKQGRLIGAYFASNRIANCSDGNRIFATLAIQLMHALPSTKRYIYRAINEDPYIFTKVREVQMRKLIVEPIKEVARFARFLKTIRLRSYPTLIVIDGLDECTGKDVQCDIIRVIGDAMKDVRLPLRFLIASRPEPHVCQAIDKLRSQSLNDRMASMDLREYFLVHRDIRHYFRVKFKEARAMHPELPPDWPGADVIAELVDKASGQFIYATTIMPYILSPHYSSEDRLAIIQGLMDKPSGDAPYENLDQLYCHIVRNATRRDDVLQIMAFLIVISLIISTTDTPATTTSTFAVLSSPLQLDQILGLKHGEVRRCLVDMHSLVGIGDDNRDIRIYHKSFPDFLLDPSRSKEFNIKIEDGMYNQIYSHLIRTSRHRDAVLQILGQVIIARNMPSEVDIFGTPTNSSSLRRLTSIFGLKYGELGRVIADIQLMLELGDDDQDIMIRHTFFVEFLLDRSRSRELFVDVDEAWLTLRRAPIRWIFNVEGMWSGHPVCNVH